jgi:peroxin-19
MAEKPPARVEETAPDPDEDDLDDLDDVLDSFSSKPAETAHPAPPSVSTAPSASGPGRPPGDNDPEVVGPGEEELEKQLQAGMAGLMNELDANPDMQKQFEQMMQELIAAGAAPDDKEAGKHLKEAATAVGGMPGAQDNAGKAGSKGGKSEGGANAFNDTIRRTMERMQHSDTTASASANTSGAEMSEEALLAQMMRELQSSGSGDGEEDFNKMLLNMMSQLTNKEILYEPMKELHDKFPAWMEKNQDGVSKDDLSRYKDQQKLVAEIVARFERKGYADENEEDREYIVERMQKVSFGTGLSVVSAFQN